ncbi:MAG: hypothetical protein ACREMY_33130 [bacterium]
MKRAPGLEGSEPATVVIFRNGYVPVTAPVPGASPNNANLGLVVCVVIDGGFRAVFSNIDQTGSRLDK